MRSLRYLILNFTILFAVACQTAATPLPLPKRLADIQATGKIIVGTAITAPFEYHETTNSDLVGFDIDLVKSIASRLNAKAEFKEMAFADLTSELALGHVDMVIAAMYITDARKKIVDFSQPYLDTGLALVTRSGSSIKTSQDLGGKTVGVKDGATGQTWAEMLRDQKGITLTIHKYAQTLESLDDLNKGLIDAVLNDKLNTLEYIKTHPDIAIQGDILSPAGLGIAVRKDDSDLRNFVDATLSDLKKSGEIQRLFDRWINSVPVKK